MNFFGAVLKVNHSYGECCQNLVSNPGEGDLARGNPPGVRVFRPL